MAPRDYYAIVEGFNNRKRKEAELLRISIWANKATWQGSLSFQQFCNQYFPLWFDEKEDNTPVEATKEEMDAILKKHDRWMRKK